jgi:hypothetical protein
LYPCGNSFTLFKKIEMKKYLLSTLAAGILLLMSNMSFAQAPDLGTASGFILFTSNGAVSNTGITHLTGNVGTNNGSSTGFGNVDGVMNDNNGVSAAASTDLLGAYNKLNSTIPTFFPAPLLGNGATLPAGVYSITGAATLDGNLTLNGNANDVFIFQVQGSFSTAASSKVILSGGVKACNVFWKIEGLVSMASGTSMKGTVIANNSAVEINTGSTIEGRILSTTGAITVDGILGYTPVGCGSTLLTGPAAPVLNSTVCYALFSGNGGVTNDGVTLVTGDIGTNVGLTTGYDPLKVTGTIHPIPDGSTAACAADLLVLHTYMNLQPFDIELLYPAQFGNNLVLTPHTYILNAATILTDTLFLNAMGNEDAVFFIQVKGALSTSTYAKVMLINGAKAVNVFWQVEGAIEINDYSDIKGTIVCNNGAINLKTGATFEGRILVTTGALSSSAISAAITPGCGGGNVGINPLQVVYPAELAVFYPNPMTTSLVIKMPDASESNSSQLKIYNSLGSLVIFTTMTQKTTTIANNLPSGVYFYNIIRNNRTVQSGKLISKK